MVRNRLDDIVTTDVSESFFKYYTFNFGHKFELYDLNLTLEPSLLIRNIRDADFMMDFNLMAGFMEEKFIAGLSYRNLGALGILLGTKLSAFHLFYSYDVSFQRFQQYSIGTHEVTVAFSFEQNENRNKNLRRR